MIRSLHGRDLAVWATRNYGTRTHYGKTVATFSTLSREPARPSRSLSETGVCRPKFASEHSKINDNMILGGFDIENELCFQQHEQKINWLEEVPNRY